MFRKHTAFTRLPLILTGTALAWAAGCAEPDAATDAPPAADAARAQVPSDIAPLPEVAPRFAAALADAERTDVTLASGQSLSLRVRNDFAAAAEVSISARVASAAGHATVPDVARVRLAAAPGEELAQLPIDALLLPHAGLDFMAVVYLSASARYADGFVENVALPEFFVEPLASGVRVRSAERVRAREHGAALSAEAIVLQEQSTEIVIGGHVTPLADRSEYRLPPDMRAFATDPARVRAELPTREQARAALALLGRPELERTGYSFGFEGADVETLDASDTTQAPRAGEVGVTRQALIVSPLLCFQQESRFTDSGYGEDYWNQSVTTARPMTGAFVVISGPNNVTTYGYLTGGGYVLGCIQLQNVQSGSYSATVLSQGSVGGNTVAALNLGMSAGQQAVAFNVSSSGLLMLNYAPVNNFDEMNVYVIGAEHTRFHPGTTKGLYAFFTREPSTFYQWSMPNTPIWVKPAHAMLKFTIGHEQGHRYLHLHTNSFMAYDYSYNVPAGQACASPSHNLDSKEYQSGAFFEGFASFYTASVFNSEFQDDGFMRIADKTVDLENGSVDFPLAFMEHRCSTPYPGFGNETDWIRALWDLRTDSPTTPYFPSSIDGIVSWIKVTPGDAWTKTNTYLKLDAAANTVGGSLNTLWDALKDPNGINW